jgi:sortase (surface protein transpeptidase)
MRRTAATGILAIGLAFAAVIISAADSPPTGAVRSQTTRDASPSAAITARAVEIPVPEILRTAGPILDGYRVRIARLGIDLAVKEGDVARDITQQRTPEGYAFHLPGTAIPGQNGNTFLYAHARVGMFLTLWNAQAGDEVVIEEPTGTVLTYAIRDVLPRVAPSDLSSTWPTTREQLTLQTSTGPSPSDPRFVVIAFPKGP